MQAKIFRAEMNIAGVKFKANPSRYETANQIYIGKIALKKILASGNVEFRCDGEYTDDYVRDIANNYGVTDWKPVDVDSILNYNVRKHGVGLAYSINNWYPRLYNAWYRRDDNEITFVCGWNRSYTIREKVS